jgi:hypothetical protein
MLSVIMLNVVGPFLGSAFWEVPTWLIISTLYLSIYKSNWNAKLEGLGEET